MGELGCGARTIPEFNVAASTPHASPSNIKMGTWMDPAWWRAICSSRYLLICLNSQSC